MDRDSDRQPPEIPRQNRSGKGFMPAEPGAKTAPQGRGGSDKSRRQKVAERMKGTGRYEGRDFNDDEEMWGMVDDEMEGMGKRMGEYEADRKKMSDMFVRHPRSVKMLAAMAKGEDPLLVFVKEYGDDLQEALNDPDRAKEIADARADYMKRVAKEDKLKKDFAKNLNESFGSMEAAGMSQEEIENVMERICGIIDEGVTGKFSMETVEMIRKAGTYDADVTAAGEDGEVRGRNTRIKEHLAKGRGRQQGDGVPYLGGGGGVTKAPKKADIFATAEGAL